MFLAAYLVSAVWGAVLLEGRSFIPFAGTLFLAAKLPRGGIVDVGAIWVLVAAADVAVQAAGVAMLIVGLTHSSRWLERDVRKPLVTFVPGTAGAPLGASVVGRF